MIITAVMLCFLQGTAHLTQKKNNTTLSDTDSLGIFYIQNTGHYLMFTKQMKILT